ncbi:hypothetical protein JMJ55_23640 [Belnapia sp. T6]|uniref:Uncharacterized protein n=1 Tax=Belnapia mucosa TaxID=2804532 RepID=A0ABS1V9M8_9PROT|nr:hypothetical protein [Belnapia mucosa]MBL6458337.1 hypothetical protein [Belnapia mucosa]
MTGARGFYRWSSEDHITPALFQNWALFPDLTWVAPLVQACGGQAGTVTQASWSYACEELLDAKLLPYHGRNFIIADVLMHFVDENGPGLLALEVKKPGAAAQPADARKLRSYCDLPSTRMIGRRYGCFLVGERHVAATLEATGHEWHVVSWEHLRGLQAEVAKGLAIPELLRQRVVAWISRAHARYGIGAPASAPMPLAGAELATEAGYAEIRPFNLPTSVERFLLGSECVEAAASGLDPAPPYAWLSGEPSAEDVRRRKLQSTAERRIIRWQPQWNLKQEPVWP